MKFRLAFALGRTVRELEDSLGADEWAGWLAFHHHEDLPDGFFVVAKLAVEMHATMGSGKRARDFVPYFVPDPDDVPKRPVFNVGPAIAFIRENSRRGTPRKKP